MFGLLSGRISDAGLIDRPGSCANPDAAALKSMKAKKQLTAQARAIFMYSNVTPRPAKCRSAFETIRQAKCRQPHSQDHCATSARGSLPFSLVRSEAMS